MLIQAGVDIHTVKTLLGHKDLRMTMRYAHLSPENLRNAISVLDDREDGYVSVTLGAKEKGVTYVTP
jgi:integrase